MTMYKRPPFVAVDRFIVSLPTKINGYLYEADSIFYWKRHAVSVQKMRLLYGAKRIRFLPDDEKRILEYLPISQLDDMPHDDVQGPDVVEEIFETAEDTPVQASSGGDMNPTSRRTRRKRS